MITVRPIQSEEERQTCFGIRLEVFVVGQDVPEDEEIDEFDDVAQHYIAFWGDEPVGTGRLRLVDGVFIKFERVRAQCHTLDDRGDVVPALLLPRLLDRALVSQPLPYELIFQNASIH